MAPDATGKAIVVFSDGTGNSAAKMAKTNVWRLYQALDLSKPTKEGDIQQLAFYDDGVGTSSFKPLALLGGVLGWGLKRNVLDLYTFLCRNYRPGDRIYAFGFSRGAFTVRVLVGLVTHQGLLLRSNEQELAYGARDAYRAYRRRFNQTGGLVTVLRYLRDRLLTGWRRLRRQRTYQDIPKHIPETIAFVGVWDTVAAYGMPIAELTRGIDKWVWPLSMPNYILSDKVERACHGLALDDERDTFHPLLWDEVEEDRLVKGGKVAADRLQQVWFAGMHSDVGGGYANGSLAYVPLKWMMDQAASAGLRFWPEEVAEVKRRLDPAGPIHNSRRGIAGYYRYQPRKLGARIDPPDPITLIMQNPDLQHGLLTSVKIHESVIHRIRSGPDRYSPIVLPRDYRVVCSDLTVKNCPETLPQERTDGQEWVWNDVWKRRISYFATVAISLLLLLLPWIGDKTPVAACEGPECLLVPIISAAGELLPEFLQLWISSFERNAGLFAMAIAGIILLRLGSGNLQRRIHDRMYKLWQRSLNPAAGPAATNGLPADRIFRLRTSQVYLKTFQALKWRIAPTAFGLMVLVLIPLLVFVVAVGV